MTTMIARRRLLGALAGAAFAWPLSAHAQGGSERRIGVLIPFPPSDMESQRRLRAMQQELESLGWIEGRNVLFDVRWTTDNMELVRANAASLVAVKSDVIVATGGRVIPILMQLTRTVPIIIPGAADPVGTGYVASLARPGGNVTGFTLFELSMIGKQLEILKQIAPSTVRVVMVYNPDNPNTALYGRLFQESARQLGVEPIIAPIHSTRDVDRALDGMMRQPGGAAFFASDLTLTQLRFDIIASVKRRGLPALYSDRTMVTDGGLVSYDTSRIELWRRAASYVNRILRGERPGDLPFEQPTKYELFINLRTAKEQAFEIPAAVLARADEVIE